MAKYIRDFVTLWEVGDEGLDEVVQRNLGLVPEITHNNFALLFYQSAVSE